MPIFTQELAKVNIFRIGLTTKTDKYSIFIEQTFLIRRYVNYLLKLESDILNMRL